MRSGLLQVGTGGDEKHAEVVEVGEANARLVLVDEAEVAVGDIGNEDCARCVLSARRREGAGETTESGSTETGRGYEETLDRGIRENSPA